MTFENFDLNPEDLQAYWMPFTGNRQFKAQPRLVVGADRRQLLDGIAGLWCCNAGHNRPRIVQAIVKQAGELDYSPSFMKAYEAGLLIRTTGDTIALSPPLIIEKSHIDFAVDTLRDVIKALD
jgi:adenosylmethionine-8-amino-7-oxononanoate aminotransferase